MRLDCERARFTPVGQGGVRRMRGGRVGQASRRYTGDELSPLLTLHHWSCSPLVIDDSSLQEAKRRGRQALGTEHRRAREARTRSRHPAFP